MGVYSATAIAILEQTAPEAAQWWRDNAPRTLRADHIFVFHSAACQELDLDPWAFPGAFPQPSSVWPPPPTPPGAAVPQQALGPSDPRWDTVQQRAHRAKKKQQIQLVQLVFIVALATPGLTSLKHPVSPAYAHTAVIYDLSVLVICGIGLLVTSWVGRKY
jgi:hypothetical protein